jgi:prepilin-type N-terminal cleavage/methylation domain-containing protein
MMKKRAAFTLIEVLIAVMLLALIVPALFKSTELLRRSNMQLEHHIRKSRLQTQALLTLYRDIMASDGNITVRKSTYDRICMHRTRHSLYGKGWAPVCWGVTKETYELVRIEGAPVPLKLTSEGMWYADKVEKDITLFEVSYNKGDVVVVIDSKHWEKPVAFGVHGITPPKPPKKPKGKRRRKKKTDTSPSPTDTLK